MKKFTFILMACVASIFFMTTTGCSDDEPVVKNNTTDTTTTGGGEEPTVLANKLRVALKDYSIVTTANQTFGEYTTSANSTYVTVAGQDTRNGQIEFQIEFPTDSLGTFTTGSAGDASFELGTGTIGDVRREEFSGDNSVMTIKVTEYGAIGEKIKGTFSGEVKNGKTGGTINVSNGQFEVTRRDDQ